MGTQTYELDQENVDQLNSFLRGELSAVETYDQAIEKLGDEPRVLSVLERCRQSHRSRAEVLAAQIRRLGGEPAEGSGAWGSFAKLLEGGAKVFGKKAAISMLEEGEDHGLDDYKRDLNDLHGALRTFVENEILPEQQRTHDTLSSLQERL